ncbi:MAG: glycosyltransferase family 1 protein [Bacteroidales bacterium]|nr:glycosyltransferase family 1 protein [Bacteroidales bacterium]MBN2698453.1 glycosyltransferase family 1 protein [Bacteroidales bacterium]
MPEKYLHIVSFNIPYPPDYGGIVDIYYKILHLSEAGVKIILHCFSYGRQPSKELEGLCFKVYYYKRKTGLKYYLSKTPYIISTRTSNIIPEHLLKDPFPVLFEGLHSTDMMEKCKQARKKVLFRAHNIEHEYYRLLARSEKSIFKKIFFLTEAHKLKNYEPVLSSADQILCISRNELEYYNEKFGNAIHIPAFHKNRKLQINPGIGTYILYHGNLSVSENIEAVKYITRKIVAKTDYRFIIAGKNPSTSLKRWLGNYRKTEIIANPDEETLDSLISNAHINILFTFQPTGLKLKLLHSLLNGRHCLVNPEMVKGSGLEEICHVVSGPEQAIRMINLLMNKAFDEEDIEQRKAGLRDYANRINAEKIIRLIN